MERRDILKGLACVPALIPSKLETSNAASEPSKNPLDAEKLMKTDFQVGKSYKTVGGWTAKVIHIRHEIRKIPIGFVEDLELTVVHSNVPVTSMLVSASSRILVENFYEEIVQHQWNGRLMDISYANASNYRLKLPDES